MKKFIILIVIILSFAIISKNVNANTILIPDEAIRLRVIANSDSTYDQQVKLDVSFEVQNEIYNLLKDKNNINDARTTIKNNI